MLTTITARQTAGLVCIVLLATIIGAWLFQWAGYAPCDLCLKQRYAYYTGIPLAAALYVLNPPWLRQGMWVVAGLLVASAVFGVYHAGVEWKFWAGPGTCGAGLLSEGLPDLTKPVVKCDEAALRILGLSLAGWNAVVSAGLAWISWQATRSNPYGSSSASQ
jgi:disulfide bond formation protein DsbB